MVLFSEMRFSLLQWSVHLITMDKEHGTIADSIIIIQLAHSLFGRYPIGGVGKKKPALHTRPTVLAISTLDLNIKELDWCFKIFTVRTL